MTQPSRQNERMLDYLYGELEASERAEFEAQLGEDAELRAEVESFERVRQGFRALPKTSQSPDSVQRMTALLMQQAAQQAAESNPKAANAAGGEAADGKVLAFRARSVRRVLSNPAAGIFAAAAVALFWVVFRSQTPLAPPAGQPAVIPVGPTSPLATTEQFKVAAPQAPAATPPTDNQAGWLAKGTSAANPAPAAAEGRKPLETADATTTRAMPLKDAFVAGLAKPSPPAPSGTGSASTVTTAPPSRELYAKADSSKEKPKLAYRGGDDLDSLDSAMDDMPAKKSADKKPMLLAQAPAAGKKAESSLDGRFAEPPPPPPAAAPPVQLAIPQVAGPPAAAPPTEAKEGGLRAQVAQVQAHRKDRIVEELANQELAGMPGSGGHASRAGAPPPAPTQTPAAEPEAERYAQNQAAAPYGNQAADEKSDKSEKSSPPATNSTYAQNSPAASPSPSFGQSAGLSNNARRVSGNSDGESALLAAVQEQIRQGHCAEANASLQRLEQSFPATTGLAEARAQWQRSCQARMLIPPQAPQNLQNQGLQNLQQESYAPAPASNMQRSAERYKVAPSKAKRAAPPSKAASKAADY